MQRSTALCLSLIAALAVCGCRILPDTRPATPAAERALLEAGRVMVYTRTIASGMGRAGTAIVLIDAEPNAVWDLLTDYDRYHEFFPTATRSGVINRDYELVVFIAFEPLIKGSAWAVLRVEEDASAYVIRFDTLAGSAKRIHGTWRIERYADRTKLTFESELVIDFDMSDFFWNLIQGVLLRGVMDDIRDIVED